MDHKKPQARIDRTYCNPVTRTDPRDMQIQRCRNIERANISGSCPYFFIRSAASFCEQLAEVDLGQNITQDADGI